MIEKPEKFGWFNRRPGVRNPCWYCGGTGKCTWGRLGRSPEILPCAECGGKGWNLLGRKRRKGGHRLGGRTWPSHNGRKTLRKPRRSVSGGSPPSEGLNQCPPVTSPHWGIATGGPPETQTIPPRLTPGVTVRRLLSSKGASGATRKEFRPKKGTAN
jgi:hypothetical protein